jgi:hypothetical protein
VEEFAVGSEIGTEKLVWMGKGLDRVWGVGTRTVVDGRLGSVRRLEAVPKVRGEHRRGPMGYFIGVALSIAIAALAAIVGFDRERAFDPTVLMVIASYYVCSPPWVRTTWQCPDGH